MIDGFLFVSNWFVSTNLCGDFFVDINVCILCFMFIGRLFIKSMPLSSSDVEVDQ